ncbi:hypothetical protein cyc_02241 [Cyclospora cayetanensis]|uniref:Uncharacterized protein n=1 Tax=Cyclospora cayetanensis TaxID=88456 RepID=A0A1D3D8W0_9EIME|nr:hypothetical protein cyc_02241 [Cyclospora cayetanensis]
MEELRGGLEEKGLKPPAFKAAHQPLAAALQDLQHELAGVIRANRSLTESLSRARQRLRISEEGRLQLAADVSVLCTRLQSTLAAFEEKHKALPPQPCSNAEGVEQLLLLADFLRLKLHVGLQQHLDRDKRAAEASNGEGASEENFPEAPQVVEDELVPKGNASLAPAAEQQEQQPLPAERQDEPYNEVMRENKQLQQQNDFLAQQQQPLQEAASTAPDSRRRSFNKASPSTHVSAGVLPIGSPMAALDTSSRSSSSYDSELSSYRSSEGRGSTTGVLPPPPVPSQLKRPACVPCISTSKAGTGSWMGGLKEPTEYPIGN